MERLAQEGAHVNILDINKAAGEQVAIKSNFDSSVEMHGWPRVFPMAMPPALSFRLLFVLREV